jgi:F0F1-type ATP synthase assembly protein I
MRRDTELFRGMRTAGLAMTIPFLLVAGPLVGLWLGTWLDGRFGTVPWGQLGLVVLGFVAGVRETIRIIRLLKNEK